MNPSRKTSPTSADPDSDPEISVVIPAYNEGTCLTATLEAIVSYLRSRSPRGSWEVIVVDDGSTDRTADIARAVIPEGVTLLRNSVNMGKGFSVRRGVLASRGRFILFTDADLSTPIREMEGLLRALRNGSSVAVASRSLPQSTIIRKQPPARSFLSGVFLRLVRSLVVRDISDSQCGFKAFSRDAALRLFHAARVDGYAFDVEILSLARKRGMRVAEVPVTWTDSGRSTISILSLKTLRMLWDLILIRYRRA